MQEMISFLKYIATSNLINFIFMLMILCWIVSKFRIGAGMDETIKKIETSIKESEHQKLKSVRHLNLIQNAMERLPKKLEDLQQDFVVKTDGLKDRIDESTNSAIQTIGDSIEKSVEVEERKLSQNMLQTIIANSLTDSVSKIKEVLVQNPDIHYQFINESLEELKKANLK